MQNPCTFQLYSLSLQPYFLTPLSLIMNTLKPTIALLLLMLVSATSQATSTDSILSVYDAEIKKADVYFQRRQARIDSIADLPHSPQRWMEMAELYRPFQCDSAIVCYTHATTGDEPLATEARIKLVYLLASIGYYSEGFNLVEDISFVPEGLRADYYRAMNHLYGESAAYGKLSNLKQDGFRMAGLYADSLYSVLRAIPGPSLDRYRIDISNARNHRQYEKALQMCDSAFAIIAPYSHEFAIISYETAITHRSMGNEENYMLWLVRSAIADVRCGITDNGSSWMLAEIMFDQGQLTRAYHYIEYSLANAGRFNARLRYVQINPLGLMINRTYQAQQSKLSRRLQTAFFFLLALLLILAGMVVYTIRQNRRLNNLYEKQGLMNAELNTLNAQLTALNQDLSTLNGSLQEASLVKEQYICRYLEVYSEYVKRLTQMARKAGVKDPDAFQSKEMADFYRSFDNTFLSIYRSFVPEFNALLRPEEQIVPKQGELLTTELRIFALIRLGIDSSAKIAELLCYSPNTIYNYRARVKNCALGDRDNFENQVRTIGTIHLPDTK